MPSSVSASPSGSGSASASGSALSVYAFLVSFAFTSHYNCKQLKSIYANFQDMQTANRTGTGTMPRPVGLLLPIVCCLLEGPIRQSIHGPCSVALLCLRRTVGTLQRREGERDSSITFVNYVGYVHMNYVLRYDTNCKIIVPIEYTQYSYKQKVKTFLFMKDNG